MAKGPNRRRSKTCANQGGSDAISPDILHLLSSFQACHRIHRTLSPARITTRKFATPLKNGCYITTTLGTGCILKQAAHAAIWGFAVGRWVFEGGSSDLQANGYSCIVPTCLLWRMPVFCSQSLKTSATLWLTAHLRMAFTKFSYVLLSSKVERGLLLIADTCLQPASKPTIRPVHPLRCSRSSLTLCQQG